MADRLGPQRRLPRQRHTTMSTSTLENPAARESVLITSLFTAPAIYNRLSAGSKLMIRSTIFGLVPHYQLIDLHNTRLLTRSWREGALWP